jgi:hypothetical protein
MILANYVTITSASDKMLCEAIGKLIDLDAIVDRLQATDCQHCAPFTIEQVKFAFKEQQSAIVVTASANPTSPAALRHRMRVRQGATTPDTSYPQAGKTLDQREHSGKK